MNEKRLAYYSSGFMGVTLFITLFLVYQFKGTTGFYFAELFLVVNTIKDIVMHKLGFTFRGVGIKKMIIVDSILLILMIIFHISVIRWMNMKWHIDIKNGFGMS